MKDYKKYINMKTPYYTDEKVRKEIDGYKKQNAELEANLGKDIVGKERQEIKDKQHALMMKIKPLDQAYFETLVGYKYQDRTPDCLDWCQKNINLG